MSTTYKEQRTEEQKKIDDEVLERVERGLKWLEETHGPGWEDKIDLDALDLKYGARCVLGQVFAAEATNDDGGYCDGYNWAISTYEELYYQVDYGFNVDDENWNELQKAWEHVLTPLVKRVDAIE